jgi:hypothetical protein
MPSHDVTRKRSRSGLIAALVVPALLVLYPLSLGPVGWLARRGWLNGELYFVVYRPLAWMGEHYRPLDLLLQHYDKLWQ